MADVGVDLIAGLPYQTAGSWKHSLEIAASVGLTHLSVYMLEVDEDSRLGREVMAGGQRFHAHGVPADEIAADLYEAACERLPAGGFEQYEISNFAMDGHRARHNVKYWKRAPYMGFGLDAHSMLKKKQGVGNREQGTGAVRFANADELKDYAREQAGFSTALRSGRDERFVVIQDRSSEADESVVVVGEREAFEETVFLGLRMCEGVALAGMRSEWVDEFEISAKDLVGEGLMLHEDGRWKLTLRGRLLSNDVFGKLLETVAV